MVAVHQAIHNVDLVAAREQLFAKNAADVPGAAGDQNLHHVPQWPTSQAVPPTSSAETRHSWAAFILPILP